MCGNCVKKITECLLSAAGISAVEVSEDFSFVTVKCEEAKMTVEKISDMINNIHGKSFQVICFQDMK
jgi:copper chaperone CopZ